MDDLQLPVTQVDFIAVLYRDDPAALSAVAVVRFIRRMHVKCAEFCEHTRQRAGCEARNMRFDELDYTNTFDGIWACASLLHVRKADLPGMLRLIHRALKKDGVFYASFKYGEDERNKNGREFSDYTEESLRALLDETGGFRIKNIWHTHDARPERADELWVNVICLAEKDI